jgi:multidrug resistance efflux pump
MLATLDQSVVQFWVEESDLSSIAVGNRVNIVFEALPDLVYGGEITSVNPAMVTVGGTTALQLDLRIEKAPFASD